MSTPCAELLCYGTLYYLRTRTCCDYKLSSANSISDEQLVMFSYVQSKLPEWIPLKWITHLNGYHLSGPV